jgi:hypothetical protein
MKQRIKDNVATLQTLYETDFYAWAMKTAELIRQGRVHEIDWGQVAEELEDMGRSERREMAARLEKLSAHLLKWALQPKRRSTSWRRTMNEQRAELERLFEDNPSLRQLAPATLEKEYRRAVREASDETGLPPDAFPSRRPFNLDEALSEDYWPDQFPA